ncbi:MAG: undecaprenyl-diphosphatase [Parcubacteria group bacterium LiPW_41]|nr:MAG: undecaprenyl-diphosphatase [Parcubacteria group bacterium LiPW_41]
MNLFHSFILGIVEGVTEFLPISSTGHMILVSSLLNIPQTDFIKTFEISIQLGAILAVVVLFFKRFFTDWGTIKKIVVAFIPTSIIGFILYKFIKQYLIGNIFVVLWALGIVGIVFIVIEYLQSKKSKTGLSEISYKQAFLIGIAQSLAVIPGVSRSGATIMGGLLLGIGRKEIVEFSFLLAVPTMVAATGYDLLKSGSILSVDMFLPLGIGFVTSFIVALFVVRWFIKFVQTNTFTGFGIYRILIAMLFLLFFV